MKDIVLSLFDITGNMVKPWTDAGFKAICIDMQHPQGINEGRDGITRIGTDIRNGWIPDKSIIDRVAFISAFPPCDHLSVSGSRWFKGKGLRKLALSIDLFATSTEVCEWFNVPYMIENPVSTISSYWRKPDYIFHPHHFTLLEPEDNYTKKTCLWTGGGFVMPKSCQDYTLGKPDDRIHKCPPSDERHNIRSATPMGFARAVFEANKGKT